MSKNEQKGLNFSSVDLLIYMWNKRMILIIVSLVAAVASIIISLQITEKYKSTVVMFPTTGASVSKSSAVAGAEFRAYQVSNHAEV